jgi:predicted nucleic acid-binding protein
MATHLLIDTDVLTDYLRGYAAAVSYVEAQQERLLISVVTVAELDAGVREGEERSRLERFLRAFDIIPLDQRLAVQGGLYRRDYSKSHNVGLADALIAATATQWQVPLVTLNRKHFPMLQDVIVPYYKAQPNPAPNPYEDPRCQEMNAPEERMLPIFSAVLEAKRCPPLATCSVFIAVCWCTNVTAPHTA